MEEINAIMEDTNKEIDKSMSKLKVRPTTPEDRKTREFWIREWQDHRGFHYDGPYTDKPLLSFQRWPNEQYFQVREVTEPKPDRLVLDMKEAIRATHEYFSALVHQWSQHEGKLVNDSGNIIEGTDHIEELCDIAGEKIKYVFEELQRDKETE